MYVTDASETHVCLLNKFSVVDHHLLIVTREFEHQQSPLDRADFESLWRCMAEFDSLGFYNGGEISGASQPHKHLQLVPLPMAPEGPRIPIEPLLDTASTQDGIGEAAGLPFPHVFARFASGLSGSLSDAAEMTLSLYCEMMRTLGLHPDVAQTDRIERNYNLLVTRQWMLLVPRGRERFESISLNALAFAGALLVRSESEMDALKKHGPMKALEYVTST
jgi:ATP adenylyltransferase